MSVAPLFNNFNGGTDGVQVTTTDTGSGNPWDVVSNGAGNTITWDSTHVHSDALSMKIVTAAAAAVDSQTEWTGLGSLTGDVWMRCYVYLTATPNNFCVPMVVTDNAGGLSAALQINTSRVVKIEDALFGEQLGGTVAVAINQWVRLEWRVRPGIGTAQFEWWLYNSPESLTADEHLSGSTFTSKANTDQIWVGQGDQPAPTSYTFWIDDVAASTSGKIGPLFESPPELSGLSQAVNRAASF